MIIVDGMLLARRCHAKMDFLKNSCGQPTGMEYGFLKSLKSIAAKLEDDNIVVCWDSKANFRKTLDPTYKANRTGGAKLGEEWWNRLNLLKRMLTALHRGCWNLEYEADDVMASLAYLYRRFEEKVYIYSNDKDLLQAVSGNVFLVTSRESQLWLWDEEEIKADFGVTPEMFGYWKAFFGDASDNIVGVSRVRKQVLVDKLMKCVGRSCDSVVREIYSEDGWTAKEFERVLDFPVERFILNYELVKLRILSKWMDIETVAKSQFEHYLKTLEIRSINYDGPEEF